MHAVGIAPAAPTVAHDRPHTAHVRTQIARRLAGVRRYTARMQPATSSRLAPQVDIHTLGPGTAVLPAIADVRLRVHAGPPARGTCRGHHFVSTRGEIDVFPAAMEDTWHQADESRSLLLLISPTLLARAAEDLGRDPGRIGQSASPARPRARGLTPLQLRRLTAYIEEHLEHDLSLATLAEVAGLGPSHLKV